MRYIQYFLLIALWSGLAGCNPNCENITGVYFPDYPYFEEGEILIKSSDPDNLRSRNVYFNDKPAESTTFLPNVGLIAKMPSGVTGSDVQLRIQDRDCGDFVSYNINVQNDEFFVDNPQFIAPAPPQIIIPALTPPLPPNINNAWISPNNTDYCIWFVVDPVDGSSGNYVITPFVNGAGKKSQELSVRQAVCADPPKDGSDRYHQNPVYGMINTNENKIQFWVDRSAKGLGIEEFEGTFINIDDTEYHDDRLPECNGPWKTDKLYMMMVTSKTTGRTLLMYQQVTG